MRQFAVCWVVICTLFLQGFALVGHGDPAHGASAEQHTSMGALHTPDHGMDDSCENDCARDGCTFMPCPDIRHCIAATVLHAILPLPVAVWPAGTAQAPGCLGEPTPSGRDVHDVWRPPILT